MTQTYSFHYEISLSTGLCTVVCSRLDIPSLIFLDYKTVILKLPFSLFLNSQTKFYHCWNQENASLQQMGNSGLLDLFDNGSKDDKKGDKKTVDSNKKGRYYLLIKSFISRLSDCRLFFSLRYLHYIRHNCASRHTQIREHLCAAAHKVKHYQILKKDKQLQMAIQHSFLTF